MISHTFNTFHNNFCDRMALDRVQFCLRATQCPERVVRHLTWISPGNFALCNIIILCLSPLFFSLSRFISPCYPRRVTVEAALHVFDGINFIRIVLKLKHSIAGRAVGYRPRFRCDLVKPMLMHAVSLVFPRKLSPHSEGPFSIT